MLRGTVSFSESEQAPNDSPSLSNYTENELKEMKEKFAMFDDDGGGGIGAEELEKRIHISF